MQQRPPLQATRQVTRAVGTDLVAMNPGFLVRSVQVDNPSGSWLQLTPHAILVPPYTIGVIANISPAAQVLDLQYVEGPNEAVSTTAGTPAAITLFEDILAPSPGYTFLTFGVNSTPTAFVTKEALTARASLAVVLAPLLIDPGADSRVRLYTMRALFDFGAGDFNYFSPCEVRFYQESQPPASVQSMIATLSLDGNNIRDEITYEGGLDLDVGQAVRLVFRAYHADQRLNVHATYAIL